MPEIKLVFHGGVDLELSKLTNKSGWSASNLIRFREGMPEKIGGWTAVSQALIGLCRALHFWSDLTGVTRLAVGTTTSLLLAPGGSQLPFSQNIDITPAGFVPGLASSGAKPFGLLIWSLDNFGQNLIAIPSGGPIYVWAPPTTSAVAEKVTQGPASNQGGFVAADLQMLIAYGCSAVSGGGDIAAAQIPTSGTDLTLTSASVTITPTGVVVLTFGQETAVRALFVTGTDDAGNTVSENLAVPANVPGTVKSVQKFHTITKATPSGGGWSASAKLGIDTIVVDPMIVRWCDQSDYTVWIATTTNQAGSFRLPRGNRIIAGIQGPSVGFIWTDFSLWSMQYIGFPLVFSFRELGENCGLIAQKAFAIVGSAVYWMSDHGFFRVAGGGVEQIPCTVWDFVFKDIDEKNQDKCFCALNYHFSEIGFFFPSISGATGEIDSYVKFNTTENLWDCGRLVRTAWIDSNRPGPPLGVDHDGIIQQHDTSVDANGKPMTGVFVQSGFTDLSDGNQIMLANRLIPDFVWGESDANAEIEISFLYRNFPGDTVSIAGPFIVTQQTEFATLTSLLADGQTPAIGIRAREVAIKIASNKLGVFWRNGTNRVRTQADGKL